VCVQVEQHQLAAAAKWALNAEIPEHLARKTVVGADAAVVEQLVGVAAGAAPDLTDRGPEVLCAEDVLAALAQLDGLQRDAAADSAADLLEQPPWYVLECVWV
jgi:hypothetical protein